MNVHSLKTLGDNFFFQLILFRPDKPASLMRQQPVFISFGRYRHGRNFIILSYAGRKPKSRSMKTFTWKLLLDCV